MSPRRKNMTIILTKFRIFRYNYLPMGMHTSGYIFQDILEVLLGDISVVRIYTFSYNSKSSIISFLLDYKQSFNSKTPG